MTSLKNSIELKGSRDFPIANQEAIRSTREKVEEDLLEVEEEINECNLLGRPVNINLVFQHKVLEGIKKSYRELYYSTVN